MIFKNIFLILIALLLISFMGTAQAADTTNCSSTTIVEGPDFILYHGTMTFGVAGGTDNATSRAFWIGSANAVYGGIQVYFTDGTGTEDANGILLYSCQPTVDLTYFTSGTTYAGLDQIQVATKYDTLGVNAGADDEFKRSLWMVLKLDGQTGNPHSSVCNFFIYLHKNSNAPKSGTAAVKSTT